MWLAFVRWWVVLLGGTLLGAGLVLHAQVALAHQSRDEVQGVFFLWRGLGQLTVIFQDDTTKMALWLNEVPEALLVESDRAAWTLVVIGAFFAITAVFLQRRPGKGKGASKARAR